MPHYGAVVIRLTTFSIHKIPNYKQSGIAIIRRRFQSISKRERLELSTGYVLSIPFCGIIGYSVRLYRKWYTFCWRSVCLSAPSLPARYPGYDSASGFRFFCPLCENYSREILDVVIARLWTYLTLCGNVGITKA